MPPDWSCWVALRIRKSCRDVAQLEGCHRGHRAQQPRPAQPSDLDPYRTSCRRHIPLRRARREGDRDDGEKARNSGQIECRSDADPGDQPRCEQWTGDRAEIVARSLEAEGTAVCRSRRGRRQDAVARRRPDAARDPCERAKHSDLPHRDRDSNEPGGDGGAQVAAAREPASPVRLIGEGPRPKLGKPHEAVTDALDETKGSRRGVQRCGDERRQQRGGDLMPRVGEEARRAHPHHPAGQPALLRLIHVRCTPL